MEENNEKNENVIFLYNKIININIFKSILILFIIICILVFSYEYNNIINNNKNKYNNSKMGNYKLYDISKFTQISILLLNIEKFIFNDKTLLSLIKNIKNQTLKDLQIIFCMSKDTKLDYINLIKNYSKNDKRIEIYHLKNNNIFNNICDLFYKIIGRYTIIIKEYILFDNDELNKFILFTRGKINNIFNFTTKNDNSLYLIKSKLLNDICDNNFYYQNFNELIDYIFLIPEPQVNYISIAFCPNNYYTPLTYVSMTSILISKNINTYISFYIIIPKDFLIKNINFLNSLYEQYDYFNITFLKMDDRYNKAYISRYITNHAYYRFSLGELIPNLNRILYLDSDTICYKDLSNFYNINFKGKIILGQVIITNNNKKTGYYRINSGILLLNLKEMRKIKVEEKILNIINNNYKNNFHDQAIINLYFYKHIGIFPPQYHGRFYMNYDEIVEYNKKSGNIYDNDYLYFSWKYPTIKHFIGYSKPNFHNRFNKEDWWYFARKSRYFNKKSYNLSIIFNVN